MADNLRLTGSLANIIVAERVHAQATRATFGDFATINIPQTALSITLASCWFYAMGYLPVWYLEHKLHGNRQEAQV